METLTDKKTRRWLSLMRFGAKVGCHQMPERSFSFRGYQFPVCARCTGVVIGELFSIIAILCSLEIHPLTAGALVVPLAVDGGVQYLKIWLSNNIRRVITGFFAGFGLTYLYYFLLSWLICAIWGMFTSV